MFFEFILIVPYLLSEGLKMPNKKKYASIRNNPLRLEQTRNYNATWIKTNRTKYPFTHFSKDFHHRKKVSITPFQFWCLAKRQKLICPLSGRKLSGDTMSVDHRIPISKGGTHDLSNLQFVHVDVNYAKRNLTESDFIQMCKDVALFN